jgi:hypothetical protein
MTTTDQHKALRDAMEAFPEGWRIDAARPGAIHGIANIGAIDEGEFYGYISVDTDDYSQPEHAKTIAEYIVAANPAAIRALLAERDAAVRDAERYRWLRDGQESDWAICVWADDRDGRGWYRDARNADIVEAAIDAAMKGQP